MPQVLDVVQRTDQWREAKRGRIGASDLNDVIRGRWDTLARRIRDEISGAEIKIFEYEPAALAWGHKHEAEAAAYYELLNDCDTQQVGFVVHSTIGYLGCSPDRFVGTDGGVEIKCPFNEEVHASYLLEHSVPQEHVAQVQGTIWICERDWWDFMSFDPRRMGSARSHVVRAYRDDEYIQRLEESVAGFWQFIQSGERRRDPVGSIPKLF